MTLHELMLRKNYYYLWNGLALYSLWSLDIFHFKNRLKNFVPMYIHTRHRNFCSLSLSSFWVIIGLPDFSWQNIPKRGKTYQISTTLPNGLYLKYQMAVKYSKSPYVKYTDIINSKPLQNLHKFGFFVWIYTIWQPWNSRCCAIDERTLIERSCLTQIRRFDGGLSRPRSSRFAWEEEKTTKRFLLYLNILLWRQCCM
jgi:hypothetical protein